MIRIRPARDADAGQIIAMIAAVYGEYPGCVLDVDGEAPELRTPASCFAARGEALWVAERGRRIVATVGCRPASLAGLELLRLYVAREARRRGLGRRLVALVEQEARRRATRSVELWTDSRFTAAQRLYAALGYRRSPGRRLLHDLSASVEYHYRKEIPRSRLAEPRSTRCSTGPVRLE